RNRKTGTATRRERILDDRSTDSRRGVGRAADHNREQQRQRRDDPPPARACEHRSERASGHVYLPSLSACHPRDRASTTRSTGTDASRCAASTSSAELLVKREKHASSPCMNVEPRNSIRCPSACSVAAAAATRDASDWACCRVGPAALRWATSAC